MADLAAFASALDRRRADFQVLLRGLPFQNPVGEDVVPAWEEFYSPANRMLGVDDSHVLVSFIKVYLTVSR